MRLIKYWLGLLLAIALTSTVFAQTTGVHGNLNSASTACITGGTTPNCLVLKVTSTTGAVVLSLGTSVWNGTVQFEAAGDPQSVIFTSLAVTPSAGGSQVTSATSASSGAAQNFQVGVSGYTAIRIRMSSYSSGTLVATINPSAVAWLGSPGSGSPSGVTSVTMAGTPNEITVTGTCTITSTGTCTFSIPSPFIAPGNVTATGLLSSTSDGVHAGYTNLVGNTANPAITSNTVGLLGPTSATFTAYGLQLPATAPSGNQTLVCPTPSSSVSACSFATRPWLSCDGKGLGDGLNAIPAGTYLQSSCKNISGGTVTITGVQCYTDNGGSSTMNAAGNTLGALLTGAITCSASYAAGTQSANVLLTANDYIKFTFVADGTTKQTDWVVTGTY